jgi:hypothetical protein
MSEPSRFSKIDADRILERAAEIEGSEDARRLTVEELRLIAAEAGFGPRAVDRAIAEALAASSVEIRRPPVQRWGILVTHYSTIRQIPVGIDSEQLMRVVRIFQPYRDGPAHLKLEEHEITWRDRKGLQFSVHSVGGVTEIRVFLSRVLLRRGRWLGWVKAAADRLEMLVLMVADRDMEPAAGSSRRRIATGPSGEPAAR